jgi:predicted porin
MRGLALAAAVSAAVAVPQSAGAFGMMEVGEWEIEFSGNVNGFVTLQECNAPGDGGIVAGGLACGSIAPDRDIGNIRTGLLPSWFGFHAQRDFGDITAGVTLGFQPGIDGNASPGRLTGGPIDGGLERGDAEFRQAFIDFGGDWGTIKVGRDLGLFASDAILNDMTLLGVGTISDLAEPGGFTTLGRIGVGYLYADWKAQVQYASPNWNGFSFAVALVDPWGAVNLSGMSLDAGSFQQENDTFGIEGKASYAWEGDFSGTVWASFISQSINTRSTQFSDQDALGFDIGAKVGYAGFELLGYYYTGDGIGTTDFLFDAIDGSGETRDSDGGYIQATYTLPGPGTKLGVSFGQSNLDLGSGDMSGSALVEKNESFVLGIYHPLTEALNLVVEYTQTTATAHNGAEAEETVFSFGAIMFY